jgi:hypothetical protein
MIHPSHPERTDAPADDTLSAVRPSHGDGVVTGAVHRPQDIHYDPAGEPLVLSDTSVRDQKAGGDLTDREFETRDDNYIDDAAGAGLNRQLQRDIGTSLNQSAPVKSPRLSNDTHDQAAQPAVQTSPVEDQDNTSKKP